MRFSTIGFILCQITVLSQADKTHFSQSTKKYHDKDLETSETRYRSNEGYSKRDFPNFDRIPRRELDLPITFKAPHYEAYDYWQSKQDHYDRKTFFEDFSYSSQDKKTDFPGFIQYMTSIFGGRHESSPATFQHSRHRVTPPYSFNAPFGFRPTEHNYIPPPKPIRASVVKLETITRSPFYSSFEHETTTKYYPHLGTILNHVLISENSKAQKIENSHPQELHAKIKIPPFRPLPVLPKPRYIPPTTLQPIYPEFFSNKTRYKYYNETDYKYPESVQDQLPHLNIEDVKIPYVSEKPIPQIFDTFSTETPPQPQPIYPEDFFPPSDSRATTNILGLIDIRNLNPPGINSENRERLIGNSRGVKFELDKTTVKSFPGAVEKVKRPTFKYTKKLTAQLDKSSVERVTNLTVQGFSKIEKENTNSPKQFNYFNVKDLINYEMGKLENSQSALRPNQTAVNDSLIRPVNLNDELSLDAKILKDTNWDGLTAPTMSTTTNMPKETTLPQSTESQVKRNQTAFWEIVQERGTTFSTFPEIATETIITTERSSKLQTTPEFPLWPSTFEITATSETITTEETTTRRNAQRRSKNHFDYDFPKPTNEDFEISVTTIPPEKTTLKKRYSRRPKIVNFTPYPTVEELQKKLINRNNFPKRQKPNITLAFGNKNVLKNRHSLEKVELMKFSNEDTTKRKKIGKRRQIFKRIKVSTSEGPAEND